jgi:alpha-ketoglutarate-dependent taurine dioxygenase
MKKVVLLASILSSAATADEGACTAGSTDNVYSHAAAALKISMDPPPASDLRVPIRGRQRLTYSFRQELPEYITSPSTATFPLVVLAGNQTTQADGAAAPTSYTDAPAPTIADYASAARSLFAEKLVSHGAVLLRGLPLADSADYSTFVTALGWDAVKLAGGGTQRSDIQSNVRSASDEPPEQTIEPHMDMAHSVAHPKRIGFFMAAGPPAGAGGETVLTNMRAVYKQLEALGVPQAFEAKGGVAYHKRLWSSERVNHTYTWQKFFFTPELDQALAEVRRRDPHARVHEHGPEVIDFREVLPAVHPHPSTGEPTWFNGVHTNHRSYYEEAEHVDTSDGSPMDTTYADGTPIADETLAAIRAAYWENSVAIPLRTGDLVVVDNMLASHGRMSWIPPAPRKMLLTHFSGGF